MRYLLCLVVVLAFFAPAAVAQLPPALYVTDDLNKTILRIAPGGGPGSVTTFASGFNSPAGLAFGPAGNLFVADFGTNSIKRVTPAGVVTTFATGINNPAGLAFDASGNLFATSLFDWTVHKITPSGTVSLFASGFNAPQDLAFSPSGILYVSDNGTNSIKKVTPDGTVTTLTTGLGGPTGITTDAAGNVYAANFLNTTVVKITPDGTRTPYVNTASPAPNWDVAFAPSGNLFITHEGTSAVYEYPAGGSLSLYANGLGTPTYAAFAPVPEPTAVLLACTAFGVPAAAAWTRWRRRLV